MAKQTPSPDSLIVFKNSQRQPGRGTLLHLTRHSVALEVYNPFSIVQLSEMLQELTILRQGRAIYHGRAVVTALVPTGTLTIVSAALVDTWSDLSGLVAARDIRDETERFIDGWEERCRLIPSYQLAVNRLASFLQELDRWLGQAEALGTNDPAVSLLTQHHLFHEVWVPVEQKLDELFAAFEREASQIGPEEIPVHKAFCQRELHPLLMCDPFIHRCFTKPLGYAGDYQMVNMILGAATGQAQGTYAKMVNHYHLTRAPATAHRNRIHALEKMLCDETRRQTAAGGRLRVLNVGCGPAAEVERFVTKYPESSDCDLTLVDFNQETLAYAEAQLEAACKRAGRTVSSSTVHQSINDLLKSAASGRSELSGQYDLVYCAGLLDYLSDRVSKRLVRLFYDWVTPGGLVVVTNVHSRNPVRSSMSHISEWHLEYRDDAQVLGLASSDMPARVWADATGVNLFLEIRKPAE